MMRLQPYSQTAPYAVTSPWHCSALTDNMTPVGTGGAVGEAIYLRICPEPESGYQALKASPLPGWRRWLTEVQMECTTAGLGKLAPDQAAVQRLWDRLEPKDAGEQQPGIPRFWKDAKIILSLSPPGETKVKLYQADWSAMVPSDDLADEPDIAIYLDPYWLWGDGKPAGKLAPETIDQLRMRHGQTMDWWKKRKKGLMNMPESYWRPELELSFEHERFEALRAQEMAVTYCCEHGVSGIQPADLVKLSMEFEGPAHAMTIRCIDGFSDQQGVPPTADSPGLPMLPAERAYYRDCKRKLIEQGFGDDPQIKNWNV